MPTFSQFEDRYLGYSCYAVDVPWDYLEQWIANHDDPKIDLDPDFQRAHVWNEAQQRAFVEYKIRGGKDGGNLLFNCVGWMTTFKGPFVLVDGKQRMEAVRKFLRNELRIFGGYRFDDFTDSMGIVTSGCLFRAHINNLPTREDVLRWYLAVNTGGTPHTEDEINRVKALLDREIKG